MTPCAKPNHQGGVACQTCADHATFNRAAARRRETGIKLGRWCVMADKNQLVSIEEFWNGWTELLGKQRAADFLIVCMRKGDEALRDAMKRKDKK